jgi:hypothetical protein
MTFKPSPALGVDCFAGNPTCADGYAWIQAHLQALCSNWLPPGSKLGDRRKGNLGEFIAFHVSEDSGFCGKGYFCMVGNANKPLSSSSDPGLDIAFVYLDPKDDEDQDRLYIQEVKTTGSATLSYADALTEDHKKLQAADANTNLLSRIQAIKGTLKYQFKLAKPFLDRVEKMGHPDANKCKKVILLPTLVHEKHMANPGKKLSQVKVDIAALGWPASNIFPRSIALTRLNDGLLALAMNQVFVP